MNNTIKVRAAAFLMCGTIAVTGFGNSLVSSTEVQLETGKNASGSTNTISDVTTIVINSVNDILKYGTAEEKVLNAAPLDPMITNDKWLDAKVEEILAKVTTEDMSNYEKVRAINNYMVQTFKFESSLKATNVNYKSTYDKKIVQRAKGILSTGYGTCTEWAALFMVLTRNIGLEVYSITGSYKDGDHTWNILRTNGEDYIFDSELDFRVSGDGNGPTKYRNFCTKNATNYHPFNKEGNVNSFKNFSVY